jgi:hypothetical protein
MIDTQPIGAVQKIERPRIASIRPGIINQNRGVAGTIANHAANHYYMFISAIARMMTRPKPNEKYCRVLTHNVCNRISSQRGRYRHSRKTVYPKGVADLRIMYSHILAINAGPSGNVIRSLKTVPS